MLLISAYSEQAGLLRAIAYLAARIEGLDKCGSERGPAV